MIETPIEEVLERVRGEFGLNKIRVREAVEHLNLTAATSAKEIVKFPPQR